MHTTKEHGPGLGRILVLCGLLMMLVQVHRSAGSVIATELSDLGFTPSSISTIVGAMFLASALCQLPMGVLLDRYGARSTLTGLGLIGVLGIAIFALSESALWLACGRFLIGIGHGGAIAGIYVLALSWVDPSRVATVTGGVVAIAGGLGGIAATAPLLHALETMGHRMTFSVIAVITLAATVAFGVFVRDTPSRTDQARERETLQQSLRGLWAVLGERKLWPIFAMASCFALPFHAIGGLWAGPFLHDVHGLSNAQASIAVLYMVIAFHLGNLLYGPIERACGSRKWTVAAGAASMILILTTLSCIPDLGVNTIVLLLVLFCLCTPFYPVLAAQCREFVTLGRAGRAIACVNLMGLTTVFLLQMVTGWAVEATAQSTGVPSIDGYRLVFVIVAGTLGLALLGYLKVDDNRRGVARANHMVD